MHIPPNAKWALVENGAATKVLRDSDTFTHDGYVYRVESAPADVRKAAGVLPVAHTSPRGEWWQWTDSQNVTVGADAVTVEQIWQDRPLADVQAEVLSRIAAHRWQVEVGGMVMTDGTVVATDRDTQAKLITARIVAKEDAAYTAQWKLPGGFVTLDATQIIAIADAVRAHVQAAFDAEAMHTAAVNALTEVADVAAYDYTTGWPANPAAVGGA